jgi:hypothetical protein
MSTFSCTTEVQYDEKSGEYFVTFPDELLEEMQWAEGDTLEWEFFEHHDSPGIRIHKIGE